MEPPAPAFFQYPRTDEGLTALLRDLLFEPRGAEAQQRAVDDVLDLPRDEPDVCWRLIELAAVMPLTVEQACYIAAGPLEDLLGFHGEQFFDRVEATIRREPTMRVIAAGVWRGVMSKPMWERFQALRAKLGIEPL